MDPSLLNTLAGEAGTAVVTLLVTESWQQARDGIVAVWRRHRPQAADEVGRELETSRRALLAAADSGNPEATGQHVASDWQQRVAGLLGEHPDAGEELRTLLARLRSEPARQQIHGNVRLQAKASGSSRIYQSMGDQHITEQ
ncbi:hypothetical protein [Streptomyces sp. MK7]|uniref:hypothetical protein n=1 Tax=Streptomyces sp. MK7 TaxID=3067635 RepID=UPI00292EF360|nr:hypothetical protein [Streptomyces sp. MK7]